MSQPEINFNEDPNKILIDWINGYNKTKFSPGQLLFGMPVAYPANQPHNTSVMVYAKKFSGYKGQVVLSYDRWEIQKTAEGDNTQFNLGTAKTLHDLLDSINSQLGIKLRPEDVYDAPLPQKPGGATNIYTQELVVVDYSLVYLGKLTFTIKTNELVLSDVVSTRIINPFQYTPPT